MENALKDSCDRLTACYRAADSAFLMEHSTLLLSGCLLCMRQGKEADPVRLRECRALLKKEESVFSLYRSTGELALCFLMALSDDPLAALRKTEHVTEKLANFWSGSEALSAAIMITENASFSEFDDKALRTRDILNEMNRNHPVLTAENDLPFAALLAVNESEGRDLLQDAEDCYRLIRKGMKTSHETAQILSLILSIYPSAPKAKVGRISNITKSLLSRAPRFSLDKPAALIGILAEAGGSKDGLAEDIADADAYLESFPVMKGLFGNGSANRKIASIFLTALTHAIKPLSSSACCTMTALALDSVSRTRSC